MNKQEIMQMKVMSLQLTAGDLTRALPIYDWLRAKTDESGAPQAHVVQVLAVPEQDPEVEAVTPNA
jgi:hypothetical protein